MKSKNMLWVALPVAVLLSGCTPAYETPALSASDVSKEQSIEIIDGKEIKETAKPESSDAAKDKADGDTTETNSPPNTVEGIEGEIYSSKNLPEGGEISKDGTLMVEIPFEEESSNADTGKTVLSDDTRTGLEEAWTAYSDARKAGNDKKACSYVYLAKDTPVSKCLDYLKTDSFDKPIKVDFKKAAGGFYPASKTAVLVQPNESGVGVADKLTFKESDKGGWKVYLETVSS